MAFLPNVMSQTSQMSAFTLPSAYERPMFYVAVYALLGLFIVLGESLGTAALELGAYRASRILFQRLLYGVTRATMRWHDATPTGAICFFLPLLQLWTFVIFTPRRPLSLTNAYSALIVTWFCKDFETIDAVIASSFAITMQRVASVTLSVWTIVIISPLFLIPGAIIAYFVSTISFYVIVTC